MAKLRIRTWGDPILKTRALPIAEITPEIRQLAADMLETLSGEEGVGLAANQVGIAQRIFVAEIPTKSGLPARYVVINPTLNARSRETETVEEGCLSFPGIFGPVERHLQVEVTGLDLQGKTVTIAGAGLLARALQHELDHLDGLVFVERMPLVQRVMLNRQLRTLAKHTQGVLAGRSTLTI
jgi:peptide deformylase